MIEGLCIEIKTDELAKLLNDRAEKHEKNGARIRGARETFLKEANVKLEEADRLIAATEDSEFPGMIEDRRSIGLSNLKATVRDFTMRIDNEDSAAANCKFIASHLVKGETYRLGAYELSDGSSFGGSFIGSAPVMRGRRL